MNNNCKEEQIETMIKNDEFTEKEDILKDENNKDLIDKTKILQEKLKKIFNTREEHNTKINQNDEIPECKEDNDKNKKEEQSGIKDHIFNEKNNKDDIISLSLPFSIILISLSLSFSIVLEFLSIKKFDSSK